MPSRSLTIALIGTVLLSGCTVPALDAGSSEPKPSPEKPQEFTNSSVQRFVEATEETRIYNNALASGPTESHINCEAVVGEKHESTYLLYVQCLGGIELSRGEHVDIGEVSFYSVSPQTTKRSANQNVTSRSYNQSPPGRAGFQIVNFDRSTQNATVKIDRKKTSATEFNATYTLRPNQSVIQNFLPYEFNSSHRMRVDTTNGTATFAFTPRKKQTRLGHGTIIYIIQSGDVVVAEIPPNVVQPNSERQPTLTTEQLSNTSSRTSANSRKVS